MAIKKKRNDTSEFWKKDKVRSVFLKMCQISYKPSVNWDKFRALDTKGIFKNFDNSRLSMKFRNIRLREEGMCWYCGNVESDGRNGLCLICNEKVKEINLNYINSIKGE